MSDKINIERAIISSILNEPSIYEDINLKSYHFKDIRLREVFSVIEALHKKDFPLDDRFIVDQKPHLESIMIDVLATTPIVQLGHYEDILIESYNKSNLLLEINKLKNDNLTYIEALAKLDNITQQTDTSKFFNIKNSSKVEAETPTFYLKDICPIQKNEINLFSAGGGAGKSYVVLYLLLELQKSKVDTFGYFSEDSLGVTKSRINNLKKIHKHLEYIDIDMIGKETILQNFIQYDRNRNLVPTDFFYKFKKAMRPYQIIVLDPLISLIAQDENNNYEVRFLMNLLNQWIEKENKTLILIHHHSKGKDGQVRGASSLVDSIRLHYVVKKKENNEEDRFIKLEKTNHFNGSSEFRINIFENNFTKKNNDTISSTKNLLDEEEDF